MGEIIKADFINYQGDLKAEDVLREIAEEKPEFVFVIAWPSDGSMPSYHSNTDDVPVIVMRLLQFIHKVFNKDFGEV